MKTLLFLIPFLIGCATIDSAINGTPYQKKADEIARRAEQIDCSEAESDCLCRAEWMVAEAAKSGMFQNVKIEVQKTDTSFHAYVIFYPNDGSGPIEKRKWEWKRKV